MQRLEVSCAVRRIYTSLGAKGLSDVWMTCKGDAAHNVRISKEMTVKNALQHSLNTWVSLSIRPVRTRVNCPTSGQHYGKAVPVHPMKTYKNGGNIAPIILILGEVSRWVVRFTSLGTNRRYPVTGRLWILDVLEYKLLPPAGFERRIVQLVTESIYRPRYPQWHS